MERSRPSSQPSHSAHHRNSPSSLTAKERHTTQFLHAFLAKLLTRLSQQFGGHTTINHLRVGNFIGLRSQYAGQPTSNAEIAKELKLSRPTVSRIVDDFVRWGWVVERVHPEDGRKRQLVIAPGHRREDEFEKFFRVMLNDLISRYGNGELVVVDPEKKSF